MVFEGAHGYIFDGFKFSFAIEAQDDALCLLVTALNERDQLIMEESYPLGSQLARDWLLFERLLAAVGPRRPAVVQVGKRTRGSPPPPSRRARATALPTAHGRFPH